MRYLNSLAVLSVTSLFLGHVSAAAKKSTTSPVKSSILAKAVTTSVKPSSTASISTSVAVSASNTRVADGACTHGPLSRECWSNGYSVKTDFDQKHPTTGKVVSYDLTITNTTCNFDGTADNICLLVNGQYPGPVITADWGDTLSITVHNKMQDNGTSMHWHGIRQLNSPGSDGVNGISECPLAPGYSKTYTFLCTQFGTSWYHSHHSSQYGAGVVGPIVINGPATANYDVDLGPFPITDHYHQGPYVADDQTLANLNAASPGGPPNADNILVNGTMSSNGKGSYAKVTIQPGKKHRLRLINTSVDNFIRVKLDNHAFTVMTADFIPVQPMAGQDWVLLAIGQRYDVVFTANATAGTYWFRAEVAGDCFSSNNGNGRALFTYAGSTISAPADSNEAPPSTGCTELVTIPYWNQAVDQTQYETELKSLTVGLTVTLESEGVKSNGKNLVLWALNQSSMNVEWDKPTIQYVMEKNTSYPEYADIIEIPSSQANQWTFWLIQSLQTANQAPPVSIAAPPPPHPIHLHGSDFFVLGSGPGSYDGSTTGLNFKNPPRRDTSTLPSQGWLAIAFTATNPGAWLMHCHIAAHISEGLGVQFLVSKELMTLPDQAQFDDQCKAWKAYEPTMAYPKYDSGL